MKRLSWIFIIMLSVPVTWIFARPWNGITPCVSSRRDAEKILGNDTIPHTDPLGTYWYKKARIYIDYSRRDNDSPSNDIVAKITVYPDASKTIFLSKYVKNIPDFPKGFLKREVDPKITHIGFLAYYLNADVGFDITVQKNEEGREIINSLSYYGLDSDCSKDASVLPTSK